jgi:uncharacterized protein (TIGR01777 family)
MRVETVATADTSSNRPSPSVRPLRIVIPGGEGHIGRILARRFSTLGHVVTTLSRAKGAAANSAKAWATLAWDGRNIGDWVDALEQSDVVINLSGRSVDCRYNGKNRREIMHSRVQSTALLGQAIQSLHCPPRVWLNASTATIYRHSYDRAMDEATGELGGSEPDAPESWRFSIDVAKQWEEAFFAAQTRGTRKIAMRSALVMSADPGGIFEILLRLVRMGLGGTWGTGKEYMSWIHELDFCHAVEFLIERESITGIVNLASRNPLPNDEFLSVLRNAWGIGFGLPASEWMLAVGAFLLRTETELLLKSRRVVPAILPKQGFQFQFPEWPEAARNLVEKYRKQVSKQQGGIQ